MTKTLAEEIITIIKAHSNDNPAPTQATIIRTYTDGNYADVETEDGTYRYVPVIGSNTMDTDGVIVYLDGDLNTPLLITASVDTTEIVTEWETTPSDEKVPSEKLVKTSIPTDVSDLTDTQNTPFTPKTHTHNYNDLNNKPELYNKQDILNIINATAKDHATTNNHNDLFANMTPITRNPTSSHFQLTRGSGATNTSLDDYPIGTNGLGITIELLNITHISYLRVSLTGDTSTTRAVTPTTPCTVRFECRPTNTKIYFDDELVLNETENNITSARFQVRTSANTTDEFDYRNLIIYPL